METCEALDFYKEWQGCLF